MQVNLDQAIGWKGKTYWGECEIPDDLAIALGLVQPAPESNEGEDSPTTPPPALPETEAPNQATTAAKPKRIRRKS